jgi:hypothetical protein
MLVMVVNVSLPNIVGRMTKEIERKLIGKLMTSF